MRKPVAILGILLTVIILISGSAIAQTWHYVQDVTDEENTTNPLWALFAPDGYHASLGVNLPRPILGWIIFDLDTGNEMGASQDFTVFASSTELEYYRVYISTGEYEDDWVPENGWLGNDTQDNDFTTPSDPGKEWRYIKLIGITADSTLDPYFGPEVDAVGWYG